MTSGVGTIRIWGEMVKFSHTVFALPFALMAAFLAGLHQPGGRPTAGQLALIVVCMVAARSFAMTFNRIVDAAIDARNPRTEGRPIPAGRITVRGAWVFTGVAAVAFVLGCLGFLRFHANPWPVYLSAPTLALLAGYSYTKRFTAASHFALGTAIALAPTAAWIAIHPASLGPSALILTGAVLFWIAGFDIIYACQDVDVDRREALFSLPRRLGVARALMVSRACHVVAVGLLAALGFLEPFGWVYWGAVAVTAVLLAAEQAVVRPDDLSRVNLAFFTLNGCVSLQLGGASIADLLIWGT